MAWEDNWRQEAQESIDEGRVDAALFIMEDTADRINEIEQPIEQVNTLRYLGELYQQAGKPAIADDKFAEAMRRSLEITPVWKEFSAVISVLELHRKAIKDHRGLGDLLQITLDKALLTAVSHDTQAKEIGRYIQCFNGVGTQSQVLALLRELHEINQPWLRKHALVALNKLKIKPDRIFLREAKPTAHYEADAYEKFLWQFLLAKMHRSKKPSAQYREYYETAKTLALTLPADQKPKANRMLRTLN